MSSLTANSLIFGGQVVIAANGAAYFTSETLSGNLNVANIATTQFSANVGNITTLSANSMTVVGTYGVSGANSVIGYVPSRSALGVVGTASNRTWWTVDDQSIAAGGAGAGASLQFTQNNTGYWELVNNVQSAGSYTLANDYLGFYSDGAASNRLSVYASGKVATSNVVLDDGLGNMNVGNAVTINSTTFSNTSALSSTPLSTLQNGQYSGTFTTGTGIVTIMTFVVPANYNNTQSTLQFALTTASSSTANFSMVLQTTPPLYMYNINYSGTSYAGPYIGPYTNYALTPGQTYAVTLALNSGTMYSPAVTATLTWSPPFYTNTLTMSKQLVSSSDVILAGGKGSGLKSINAAGSAPTGGAYLDAVSGNIGMLGGNALSSWSVVDQNAQAQFQVYNTAYGANGGAVVRTRSTILDDGAGNLTSANAVTANGVKVTGTTSALQLNTLNAAQMANVSANGSLTLNANTGSLSRYGANGWQTVLDTTSSVGLLSDVRITTPLANQVLAYVGNTWVNTTASLTGGSAGATAKVVRLLDNTAATATTSGPNSIPAAWSASYTNQSTSTVVASAALTAYASSAGAVSVSLLRDGAAIDTQSFYFSMAGVHQTLPTLYAVGIPTAASHTYAVQLNSANLAVNTSDTASLFVQEYAAGSANAAVRLSGLGDVSLSGAPAVNQLLLYNGNNWVNSTNLTVGNVTVSPSSSVTAKAYTLTLPATQGTALTTLVNDGTGALTWGSAASSANGVIITQMFKNAAGPSTACTSGVPTTWTGTYTSSGGPLLIIASFAAYATTAGTYTFSLQIDGVAVDTVTQNFTTTNSHTTVPTMTHYNTALTVGTHTIAMSLPSTTGAAVNGADFLDLTVQEFSGAIGTLTAPAYGYFVCSTTAQNINAASFTAVTFPTTSVSTLTGVITVSNSNTFTNTSSGTIYLDVAYSVSSTFATSGSFEQAYIRINGSSTVYYAFSQYTSTGSAQPMTGSDVIQLNSGDYFSLMYYSGAACTIGGDIRTTHISMTQIIGGVQGPAGASATINPPNYGLFNCSGTAQSIPANPTLVAFTSPTTNTWGANLTINSGSTTFTNNTGGTIYVQASFSVFCTGCTANGYVQAVIFKNGSTTCYYGNDQVATGNQTSLCVSGSAVIQMNQGDYIAVSAQGTGTFTVGTYSNSTFLNITQIIGGVQGPVGPSANLPGMYASFNNTAQQTITAGSVSQVNFPNVVVSSFGSALSVNTSANTFTNTSSGPVYINVNYTVIFQGVASGYQIQTYIRKSASGIYADSSFITTLASPATNGSCVLQLNAGDTIDVTVYSTATSNYTIYPGSSLVLTQIVGGVVGPSFSGTPNAIVCTNTSGNLTTYSALSYDGSANVVLNANLSVSGNVTIQNSLSVSGYKYYETWYTGSTSIAAGTSTFLPFNSVQTNTFGTALTFDSPTTTTQWVNNSGRTVIWNVSFALRLSASVSATVQIYRYNSSGTLVCGNYGQVATTLQAVTCCCPILVNAGDYIKLSIYCGAASTGYGATSYYNIATIAQYM